MKPRYELTGSSFCETRWPMMSQAWSERANLCGVESYETMVNPQSYPYHVIVDTEFSHSYFTEKAVFVHVFGL